MFNRFIVALLLGVLPPAAHLCAQTPADSLPSADRLRDSLLDAADALELGGLTSRAVALDSFFALKLRLAADTVSRIQQDPAWQTAKLDTISGPATLKALKKSLAAAKNAEKAGGAQHKQANRNLAFARKIEAMPPLQRRQNLPKLRKQVDELTLAAGWPVPNQQPIAAVIGTPAVSDPDSTPGASSAAPSPADSLTTAADNARKPKTRTVPAAQRYRRYDPAADVTLNPPLPPCALAQNTRDEFSGETYREVQRGELFRSTNEYVRKLLPPDQQQVTCEAALAIKGSVPSLWLTFTVRDPNARKTFGGLNRNGLAVLKFMDGQTVTIYNVRPDEGVSDPAGQVFVFRAQYSLERDILKKIRRTELDKIRIAWATGYEDYEVQNVNLLRRQATCVE